MRRTRKWAFVKQEATRLAGLELSPAEIALQLGVNKSTVTRWMASGKLPRTEARPSPSTAVLPPRKTGQSPAEWAKEVRAEYDLDATDDQLVTIAEQALTLSLNLRLTAQARMSAAGRFQALVRQLALVARKAGAETPAEPAKPAPVAPRERVIRSGVDPRNLLTAVK